MDVVRRNVESLRGTVSVASKPGEGTTITLRLPLTLALIEGFYVGVGDETYVLPLESVVECIELPRDQTRAEDDRGILNLRGQPLPFLRLRNVLAATGAGSLRESIVVIRHGDGLAGIAVDVLKGEGQTVIKPLGKLFKEIPGVLGSALLIRWTLYWIFEDPYRSRVPSLVMGSVLVIVAVQIWVVAFLADLWAHSASYLIGFVGGLVLIGRVWRSRGRAAASG